jgi:hypothetical protein
MPLPDETEDMITTVQNPAVRNFIYSLPAIIAGLALLAFLLQAIFFQSAKNDINNLKAQIVSNQYDLDNIHDCNLRFATKRFKELYSASELTAVTEKYRDYSLTLVGKEVKNSSIYVPAGIAELKLTEIAKTSGFPYEIEVYGSLTDNTTAVKLWSFINIKGVNPKARTDRNTTTVTYQIKGKSGEMVKVNLSPVLVDRLGLDFGTLFVYFF